MKTLIALATATLACAALSAYAKPPSDYPVDPYVISPQKAAEDFPGAIQAPPSPFTDKPYFFDTHSCVWDINQPENGIVFIKPTIDRLGQRICFSSKPTALGQSLISPEQAARRYPNAIQMQPGQILMVRDRHGCYFRLYEVAPGDPRFAWEREETRGRPICDQRYE